MGGKRIADQVRRALIAAAKVAPVAVAIDTSGWACSSDCTVDCLDRPAFCQEPPVASTGGTTEQRGTGGVRSTGGRANAGAPIGGGGMMGIGGRDSGEDARDASADATAPDASLDASKDGG